MVILKAAGRCCLLLGGIVALACGVLILQHGSLHEGLYLYFPLVPSKIFQGMAVYILYYGTCFGKWPGSLKCRSDGDERDLWVIVATPKGGTVLAARTGVDLGWACGLCVGLGHRPDSGWPPAKEYVPDYKSDVLQAYANMQDWPKYAATHGGRVRCVVISRDPWKKFRSLYSYVLLGAEYGILDLSRQMHLIHEKSIPDAVDFLYKTIGNVTMRDSMDFLDMSLSRPDCLQIKFEDFDQDFDAAMNRWLDQWHVTSPDVRKELLKIANKHNLKAKTKEELAKEHHTTTDILTKEQRCAVDQAIRKHPEIPSLLNDHARRLGYQTSN